MIVIEHSETFVSSASAVFAVLIDIEARPIWQPSIIEIHVTPPGLAQPGSSISEVGKFSGYKSEKTMIVNEFEQDRHLSLETPAESSAPFRASYWIEPITDSTCKLSCRVEIGGLPKVGEFFVRQSTVKELPKAFVRLKSLLAQRAG